MVSEHGEFVPVISDRAVAAFHGVVGGRLFRTCAAMFVTSDLVPLQVRHTMTLLETLLHLL